MRYIDNGDGTITDTKTGLMWQKETIGECTWGKTAGYCRGLKLAGHKDWRLPTLQELLSILDYSKRDPACDPIFESKSSWYWSSTSDEHRPDAAWFVVFSFGYVSYDLKSYVHYVRAVRTNKEEK